MRCWVRAISPGQTQQALADCNAALSIKADAADVLDTRGFIHLKLGQHDNAIKDYDAALRSIPSLPARSTAAGLPRARAVTATAAQPTSPPPRQSRPISPKSSPGTASESISQISVSNQMLKRHSDS